MSKYIRVSEDDREYLTTYQEHCEEVAALQDDGYDFEGCILKQADTIEKLCDEFVIDHKKQDEYHQTPYVWGRYAFASFKLHHSNNKKTCDYYGAIWTDKGLIYVAKMNNKGELELL